MKHILSFMMFMREFEMILSAVGAIYFLSMMFLGEQVQWMLSLREKMHLMFFRELYRVDVLKGK
jgi:hypothetical protein